MSVQNRFLAAKQDLNSAVCQHDVQASRIWRTFPKGLHLSALAASCLTTGIITSATYHDADYLRGGASAALATISVLLGKFVVHGFFDRRYREAGINAIRATRIQRQTLEVPHA